MPMFVSFAAGFYFIVAAAALSLLAAAIEENAEGLCNS